MDEDDGFDALDFGLGYAFYRDGQDRQTAALVNALRDGPVIPVGGGDDDPEPPVEPAANALDYVRGNLPQSWDDYIGQEPLKRQLMVRIASAKARGVRLPHILLASGYPGVGKTTVARLLAKVMDVPFIELAPPFNVRALVAAVQRLPDKAIVFIDEIHKLSDNGGKGSEILLKVLEDGVAPIDGRMIRLPDVTYVGATTEPDKLLEPVIDRFKIRPYFQTYSRSELAEIAVKYSSEITDDPDWLPDDLVLCIADACRQTPRIVETMVDAARDLEAAHGSIPTREELLADLEYEPDGMTRQHIHYLTAMYQYHGRVLNDGTVEYVAGESTMMTALRETRQGLGRIERFLIERGLLNRTTRGRCLTDRGIARAAEFVTVGKGVANVA